MSAHSASNATPVRVYFGTYTGAKSKGIYMSDFDPATGKLSEPQLAVTATSPSFLALHPNHRFLYAVGEDSKVGKKKMGAVMAFSIDPETGLLTLLNEQPSGGDGPCHLSVDREGRCVLTANYGSGSIAALPIESDGKVGEPATTIQHHGSSVNPQRQTGPHAHFITTDPGNRYAMACDLGLDKVLVYKLNAAKASLVTNDPPAGVVKAGLGPRHLAFHPNGRIAYVVSEMGCTVTAFAYTPKTGALEEIETVSTLPSDFKGKSYCAEIEVHPSGKFLYISNRGHNSIAVFDVDSKTGKLKLNECISTEGKFPRHFTLDPSGKWLIAENQNSDSIVVFAVDAKTGKLTPTGQTLPLGAPACAVFLSPK